MVFANTSLIVSCLVSLILVMLIIVSNPKRSLNRALAVYIASTFLWLFANLLTNVSSDPDISLFFARTTLVGAALIPYTFFVFCNYFVGTEVTVKKLVVWGLIPFAILLTTPTSLNIVMTAAYGRDTVIGPVYYLLIGELLIYPAVGIWKLLHYSHSPGVTTVERTQVKYIAVGGLLTLIPGIITNAILPLFGNSSAVFFGPNIVMILALFTSTAIIRHKLLDIRLLVARSLTYTMLMLTLLMVYAVVIFGITDRLGGSSLAIFARTLLPFIAAIGLALFFHPLKRFFDRYTNRYFYQDAYDTNDLLDEFNQTLVSTIDLEKLLKKSAQTIQKYIKPDYCAFALTNSNGSVRIINGEASKLTTQLMEQVRSYIHKSHVRILVTDLLEGGYADMKLLLNEVDAGLLARITKNANVEGLGYIILGHKKSGSIYSSQDLAALEIITNELTIAIENALHFEEIQNFAKTLQDKVDEATRNLRSANEKLKKLDETKDDFISMASHQLRTPLTSVKGYISMVLEGDTGKVNTKQKEMLNQAFISSQRMVYLIADLLNVSRLRTGKFVIEPKPTNLADVIEGEISQLTETAKGRNLTLSYEKPKTFPELMLDETKIRQVVMNFADNAIYYTPAGGHITVNLADLGDRVELTVVDDGMGVPKSEQHHLFNKFYRAGNAKKARPDGTGLGLFMAKKVVVAQGGSIIFKSTEGKGSIFGFSFAKKPLLPQNYKGPHPTTTA